MNLLKLDATDSTNDFLKQLSNNIDTPNWTVVTAENQTNGKGQMGSIWSSEAGKNLIVSVLIKNILTDINQIFDLNVATAVSIANVLINNNIPEISIKWPNDIMSGNKKIAGILIENSIKTNNIIHSIIGFGLNVNQINYDDLPKASSLKKICNQEFDKNEILNEILSELKKNIAVLEKNKQSIIWKNYHELLFKVNKVMPFENANKSKFMGIVQQVNQSGKLIVLLENDDIKEFGIKEISMIY